MPMKRLRLLRVRWNRFWEFLQTSNWLSVMISLFNQLPWESRFNTIAMFHWQTTTLNRSRSCVLMGMRTQVVKHMSRQAGRRRKFKIFHRKSLFLAARLKMAPDPTKTISRTRRSLTSHRIGPTLWKEKSIRSTLQDSGLLCRPKKVRGKLEVSSWVHPVKWDSEREWVSLI